MKKAIILFATAITMVFSCNFAKAQTNAFTTGDMMIQATIGIPYVSVGSCHIPPVGVTIEAGIADLGTAGTIGVGATAQYSKYEWAEMAFEGIVDYHYFLTDKFEVHAKMGLGYYRSSGDYGVLISGFARSFFAGASYAVSDNLAIIAEIGASYVADARIGISLKF
ncbi:MAG: hypothetical protein II858_04520 [Bacteroidales bacterium]|nr:hypothetical protein [Bacteroidales bacterium]